ncbi:hypothetical protein HZH66_011611 [Vespula vulgaris]|uniref:Uncharacterized protein n=1 Tax=Vespula vulgaris TaxID=7454 RepID=A0A834JEU5_VESVU|nr:hypothetical protein HZH66_011611 [Vespula vulgaris]
MNEHRVTTERKRDRSKQNPKGREVGGGGGDGDGGGSGGGGGDGGGSNSSSSSLAFLNEPAVAHDIQKTRARSRVFTSPLTTLRALASMSVGRVVGDHPSQ